MTGPHAGRAARAAALAAMVAASFVLGLSTVIVMAAFTSEVGDLCFDLANDSRAQPWLRLLGARIDGLAERFPEQFAEAVSQMTPTDAEGALSLAIALGLSAAPAFIAAPALRDWRPGTPGRPLRASAVGAGILGGACAVGIAATAWDAVGLLASPDGAMPPERWRGGSMFFVASLLPVAWTVGGIPWAFLVARAGSATRPDRLDALVRWLFAGTCVELAIAVPTFVAASRRDRCYCGWGSWWAIVAGATTLVLLCGPAIVMLRTRRARMAWMRSVCVGCGYPVRGPGDRCPECGLSRAPAAAPCPGPT